MSPRLAGEEVAMDRDRDRAAGILVQRTIRIVDVWMSTPFEGGRHAPGFKSWRTSREVLPNPAKQRTGFAGR